MKFRLKKGKGSVQGFTNAEGKAYLPGDIVELPASYEGEKWLERVEEKAKVVAAPSKVEVAPDTVAIQELHARAQEDMVTHTKVESAPETVPAAPLPEKKSKKTK